LLPLSNISACKMTWGTITLTQNLDTRNDHNLT